MAVQRKGVPEWAVQFLKKAGYTPRNCMDRKVSEWWEWFTCENDFYRASKLDPESQDHRTLHPAKMVCDEWASLLMTEEVGIVSDEGSMTEFVSDLLDGFAYDNADFVSRAFAMGTGAWSVDFTGMTDVSTAGATAVVRRHDARSIVPLVSCGSESVSCAFVSSVAVDGREYDQVQVHEPVEGTYHVRTFIFEKTRHGSPVALDGVVADLDTRSELPTYALVTPAIANTYEDNTPLGVAVFSDAVDQMCMVDEAFDGLYWSLRLGHTRVFMDETCLTVDERTGAVLGLTSADKKLYRRLRGAVGEQAPMNVYNPDLRVDAWTKAMESALSSLSFKCGFGSGYFRFDGVSVYKTATEVVGSQSQLSRHARRHEKSIGSAIKRVARGAYAAQKALRDGGTVRAAEVPEVEVVWPDSVIVDTETERQTMKDDIARGLCDPKLYPMTYYGMGEEEAAALITGAELPEEE